MHKPRPLVRRGSEGFEVRGINREDMLREYVVDQIHDPGRYNVYVPETQSETEDDEDEEIPLSARVESLRKEKGSHTL